MGGIALEIEINATELRMLATLTKQHSPPSFTGLSWCLQSAASLFVQPEEGEPG